MKHIILLFFFYPLVAYSSCNGYVLGIKGLNDAFDQRAFDFYTAHLNYCGKTFSWHQHKSVLNFISRNNVKYQLYAFSGGAEAVSHILKHANRNPEYVLTMGAYKTADVNFDKYGIKYNNYFDHSGIGQRSPGVFMDVSHDKIQRRVVQMLIKDQF